MGVEDWGWEKPKLQIQLSLFPWNRKEYLAKTRIGEEDLRRWHKAGWLSEECLHGETLDDHLVAEIGFVQSLATSGLLSEDIDRLLIGLEAPYRFDRWRLAYSFTLGWVQAPQMQGETDLREYMEEHLPKWLEGYLCNDDTEESFDRIAAALAAAREKQRVWRERRNEATQAGNGTKDTR